MTHPIRHSIRAGLALTLAGLAFVLALGAAAAVASTSGRTPVSVAAAHSSRLHETILVTSGSGRTLYHLTPESAYAFRGSGSHKQDLCCLQGILHA